MESLEINTGTATTFELEREVNRINRMDDLFQFETFALSNRNKFFSAQRRNFIKKNTGLYSTFSLSDDSTAEPSILGEDSSLDYDVITPLKVNKRFKIKVRIKSIKRHQPRIFFDE